MDFHSMKRKELQALCKKHGVPANLTNLEMANKLASILVKEVENKPTTRLRSCLKNVGEPASESGSDGSKESKKVKFSPQNETVVVVISEDEEVEVNRVTRRKSMARSVAKKGQNFDENVDNVKSHEEVVEKPVRPSRGRNVVDVGVVSVDLPVAETRRRKVGQKSNCVELEDKSVDKPLPVMENPVRATRSSRGRNVVDVGVVSAELPVAETKRRKLGQKSDCVELEDKSGDKPLQVMEKPVRATRSRSQRVLDRGVDSAVLPEVEAKRSKGGDNPQPVVDLSDESANQRAGVEETQELVRSLRSRVAAGKKNQKDADNVVVVLSDEPANERAGVEETREPIVRSLRSRVAAGKKNQKDADNVVVDLSDEPANERAGVEETQEAIVRSLRSRVAAGKKNQEEKQDVLVAKENKNARSLRQRNVKAFDETSKSNGQGVNGEFTELEEVSRRSKRNRKEKGDKTQQNQELGKAEVGGRSRTASSQTPQEESVSVAKSETTDETLPPRKSVQKNVSNVQNFPANDMGMRRVSSRRKSVAICDRINNVAEDTEHNEPRKRRRDTIFEQGRLMTKGSSVVDKPSRLSTRTGAKKEEVQAAAGASKMVGRKTEPSNLKGSNPEGKPLPDSSVAMKESLTIGEQDPTSGTAECENNPVLDSRTVCDVITSPKRSNHSEESMGNRQVSANVSDLAGVNTLKMVNSSQVPAVDPLLEQKDSIENRTAPSVCDAELEEQNSLFENEKNLSNHVDEVNLDLLDSLRREIEVCDTKNIVETESGLKSEADEEESIDEGFPQVTSGDDGQLPIDRLDIGANYVDTMDSVKYVGRNEILAEEENPESSYNEPHLGVHEDNASFPIDSDDAGESNQSLFENEKNFSNHVNEVNQDLPESLSREGDISDTENIAQTESGTEPEAEDVFVDEGCPQVASADDIEFQIDRLDIGANSVDTTDIVKDMGSNEMLAAEEQLDSGYSEHHLGVREDEAAILIDSDNIGRSNQSLLDVEKLVAETAEDTEPYGNSENITEVVGEHSASLCDMEGVVSKTVNKTEGDEGTQYSVDEVVVDLNDVEIITPCKENYTGEETKEASFGSEGLKSASSGLRSGLNIEDATLIAKEVSVFKSPLVTDSLRSKKEVANGNNDTVSSSKNKFSEDAMSICTHSSSNVNLKCGRIGENSEENVSSSPMKLVSDFEEEIEICSSRLLVDVDKEDDVPASDNQHMLQEEVHNGKSEGFCEGNSNGPEECEEAEVVKNVSQEDLDVNAPYHFGCFREESTTSNLEKTGSEFSLDDDKLPEYFAVPDLSATAIVPSIDSGSPNAKANCSTVKECSPSRKCQGNINHAERTEHLNFSSDWPCGAARIADTSTSHTTNGGCIFESNVLTSSEREKKIEGVFVEKAMQPFDDEVRNEGVVESESRSELADAKRTSSVNITNDADQMSLIVNTKMTYPSGNFMEYDNEDGNDDELGNMFSTPESNEHPKQSAPNISTEVVSLRKLEDSTISEVKIGNLHIDEPQIGAGLPKDEDSKTASRENASSISSRKVTDVGSGSGSGNEFTAMDVSPATATNCSPCEDSLVGEVTDSEALTSITWLIGTGHLNNFEPTVGEGIEQINSEEKHAVKTDFSLEAVNQNEFVEEFHVVGADSKFQCSEASSVQQKSCSTTQLVFNSELPLSSEPNAIWNDSECVENYGIGSMFSTPETKSHPTEEKNLSKRPEYSGKVVQQNELNADSYVVDAATNICQFSTPTEDDNESVQDHQLKTLFATPAGNAHSNSETMFSSEYNAMKDGNECVQGNYTVNRSEGDEGFLDLNDMEIIIPCKAKNIEAEEAKEASFGSEGPKSSSFTLRGGLIIKGKDSSAFKSPSVSDSLWSKKEAANGSKNPASSSNAKFSEDAMSICTHRDSSTSKMCARMVERIEERVPSSPSMKTVNDIDEETEISWSKPLVVMKKKNTELVSGNPHILQDEMHSGSSEGVCGGDKCEEAEGVENVLHGDLDINAPDHSVCSLEELIASNLEDQKNTESEFPLEDDKAVENISFPDISATVLVPATASGSPNASTNCSTGEDCSLTPKCQGNLNRAESKGYLTSSTRDTSCISECNLVTSAERENKLEGLFSQKARHLDEETDNEGVVERVSVSFEKDSPCYTEENEERSRSEFADAKRTRSVNTVRNADQISVVANHEMIPSGNFVEDDKRNEHGDYFGNMFSTPESNKHPEQGAPNIETVVVPFRKQEDSTINYLHIDEPQIVVGLPEDEDGKNASRENASPISSRKVKNVGSGGSASNEFTAVNGSPDTATNCPPCEDSFVGGDKVHKALTSITGLTETEHVKVFEPIAGEGILQMNSDEKRADKTVFSMEAVDQNECVGYFHVAGAHDNIQCSQASGVRQESRTTAQLVFNTEIALLSEQNAISNDDEHVEGYWLGPLFSTPKTNSCPLEDQNCIERLECSGKAVEHNESIEDSFVVEAGDSCQCSDTFNSPTEDNGIQTPHVDTEMVFTSENSPVEDDNGSAQDHGLRTLFATPTNDIHSDNEMRSSSKHNPVEDDCLLDNALNTLFATPAGSTHSNRKMMFSSDRNAMKDDNESVQDDDVTFSSDYNHLENASAILNDAVNAAEPDDHDVVSEEVDASVEVKKSGFSAQQDISTQVSDCDVNDNAASVEKSLEDPNVDGTGVPRASDASHDFDVEENAKESRELLFVNEPDSAEEVSVCNIACLDGGSNEYRELQNSVQASMLEEINPAENDDSVADLSLGLACSDGKIGRETSKISLEADMFTRWEIDMFSGDEIMHSTSAVSDAHLTCTGSDVSSATTENAGAIVSEVENVAEADDHGVASKGDASVEVEKSAFSAHEDIITQISDSGVYENATSELLTVGGMSAKAEVRDSEYLAEAHTHDEIVAEEEKAHCEPLLASNALLEERALEMNHMKSTSSALADAQTWEPCSELVKLKKSLNAATRLLNTTTAVKRREPVTSVAQMTPKKISFDMKENAPMSIKRNDAASVVPKSTAKRRALGDIPNQ